jgi:hypothetical protein
MKNYLIAPLLFIFNFIKVNKVKSVAIFLFFLTFSFLNSIPDYKDYTQIYKEIKLEGFKYSYITSEISNHEIDYDIETFTKKPKIVNNKIITMKYNDVNIFIWFVFILSLLFIVIPIFSDDSDIEYEMDDVYTLTLSYFVSCDFIDNEFVYHTDRKIIGKSNHQKNDRNIAYLYGINSPRILNNCPEYMSLQRARQNKLNKLGI